MLRGAHGVPGKFATTDSEIFWLNTSKPRELLPPLSRLCRYQGTASQQRGKPVLFTRPTYTFPNPMARTFGWMSGWAWPNLIAVSPKNWRAWSRRSVGNMGRDHPTPTLYSMGSCPSFLSSMAAQAPVVASHPRGGMDDCSPRAVCTHLLYSFGHAPSNVPRRLSYCVNTRPTQRTDSHGLLSRLLSACFPKGIYLFSLKPTPKAKQKYASVLESLGGASTNSPALQL